MNQKLIERMDLITQKGAFYNTACLKVTAGNDFQSVYRLLLSFVRQTIQEEGCIEFFAAPSDLDQGEIMLWEIWETEAHMQNHMSASHTQAILSKNLVELKWSNVAYWAAA